VCVAVCAAVSVAVCVAVSDAVSDVVCVAVCVAIASMQSRLTKKNPYSFFISDLKMSHELHMNTPHTTGKATVPVPTAPSSDANGWASVKPTRKKSHHSSAINDLNAKHKFYREFFWNIYICIYVCIYV